MNKKASSLMYQVIKQVIIITLLFALFFGAANAKVNSNGVKQQVLEKQIALMIDSARDGMSFKVFKVNGDGVVDSIEIREGRVFVYIGGLVSSKGYPFFTKYDVGLDKVEDGFLIKVDG
jgi:hypothetical protein